MSGLIPILDWLAPAATMIAAMMTAANLGARITGWGFAIFLVASVAWTTLGIANAQGSLIYANGFLIIVNAIGVWRWLGRQAAYEEGAHKAVARSAFETVPTLFSFSGLIGAEVTDGKGQAIGTIIDVMGESDGGDIAYFVVSEGGVVGVGERVHAVPKQSLHLSSENVSAKFDAAYLHTLPALTPGEWPVSLERAARLNDGSVVSNDPDKKASPMEPTQKQRVLIAENQNEK